MARCQQTLHLFFSLSLSLFFSPLIINFVAKSLEINHNFSSKRTLKLEWNNFFSTWQFFNIFLNYPIIPDFNFNFNPALKKLYNPHQFFITNVSTYHHHYCFTQTIDLKKLKFVTRNWVIFFLFFQLPDSWQVNGKLREPGRLLYRWLCMK